MKGTPPIFAANGIQFLNASHSVGGPGWTRTNDVSKVTSLQPATLAARLLTHI